MKAEISNTEIAETKRHVPENFKNIKPETSHTMKEMDDFWKGEFQKASEAANETDEAGNRIYRDDNGEIYRKGDHLVPDNEYTVRGYDFKTDDQGRITSAEGKLRTRSPENDGIRENVKGIDSQEYKDTDDRGHLIGLRFDGSSGLENLVPMDLHLNRGDYEKLENTLENAIKDKADVYLKVEPKYEGNSNRPAGFRVIYTIDGERDVVVFKNESEARHDG